MTNWLGGHRVYKSKIPKYVAYHIDIVGAGYVLAVPISYI